MRIFETKEQRKASGKYRTKTKFQMSYNLK